MEPRHPEVDYMESPKHLKGLIDKLTATNLKIIIITEVVPSTWGLEFQDRNLSGTQTFRP